MRCSFCCRSFTLKRLFAKIERSGDHRNFATRGYPQPVLGDPVLVERPNYKPIRSVRKHYNWYFKQHANSVMANLILAQTTASVSELKKNPMGTVAAGEGFPVAILNRNEPAFYCVPAKAYAALMDKLDKLEDLELNAIADARKGQRVVKVKLADL